MESNVRDGGCLCQRCGQRYKVDVAVSDQLWERIREGHNVICGVCIMECIEALGEFDYYDLEHE